MLRSRLRALPVLLAVALLALASTARAQVFGNSCPLTTGTPDTPDVIVGDINGVANYNTAFGMDAIALGTTSCNIGELWLNWFAGTTQVPVIGGGVFKYEVVNGSGRFEQLGQSWLKYAFFALSENFCCQTCNFTDGTHLGVGCSDPYTAARNGGQFGLGPKFSVNAHTGAHPPNAPAPVGGNNGRIQMLMSELQPSSASVRYFGEMMYVTPDDAAANHSDNNSSYRELTATFASTSIGYSWGTSGPTVRQRAGIEAWQAVDPAVVLTDIMVPEDSLAPFDGDARLILAHRVTDLGNGTWHYEYALHNMNSDRSIRAFSLPLHTGVTITNVGFRDVAYHGGDGLGGLNYDGTDWTGGVAAGTIRWSTAAFVTDPNANALRWGTTYNFRFDADSPPTSATLTLDQFKVANTVSVPGVQVPAPNPAFAAICSNATLGTDHTTACPCGNVGAAGNGCAHSFAAAGAHLEGYGAAPFDNVQLDAAGLPSAAFTLFMQHDAVGDVVFHDGVLCAGGTLVRLRGRNAAGGAALFPDSSFPNDATLTLSQRGGVTVGSGARRYYAAFFRNASTTFCPPATANVTNGWVIDW